MTKPQPISHKGDMMQLTYSMKGAAVVIHQPFREDVTLNRTSVKKAITNVKKNRAAYATEAAHFAHLARFEGALAHLDAHTAPPAGDGDAADTGE